MIQAQSADGVMHQFPDGTDPSVIDRVMKQYAQQQLAPAEPPAVPEGQWRDPMTGKVREDPGWLTRNLASLNAAISGPTDALRQGATLGLADEVGAAGGALGDAAGRAITGKSPNGLSSLVTGQQSDYGRNLEQIRGQQQAWGEEHPIADTALQVIGGLGTGLGMTKGVAPAKTLLGNIGQNAAIGAGTGAVAGAGNAEGGPYERLVGALTGGATGGALGGALPAAGAMIGRGVGLVGNALGLRNAEKQAGRLMLNALERDQVTPQDLAARAAQYPNQPVTLADVAGPNTQRLAGSAFRVPSAGRAQMLEQLEQRNFERPERIVDLMRGAMGNPEAFTQTVEQIGAQRAAAAKPLYDALRQSDPAMYNTPEVIEILNTPAGRRAIAAAEQRALNLREPFPRLVETVTDPLTGEQSLQVTKIPNFEALDQVKRSLDDIIEDARDPISRRIPSEVRDIARVRGDLVAEMDHVTGGPDGLYASARKAFAGPSASIDALNSGRAFAQGDVEDMARVFNTMSSGDKDLFRLGVVRQLREMIERGTGTRNQAAAIMGPGMRRRLAEIFPDQKSYQAFMDALRMENTMQQTSNVIRGNSSTAERLSEDATQAAALNDIADLGGAIVSGSPTRIASAGLGWAARRARGINEPVANELATALMNPSPQARNKVIAELLRTSQSRQAPRPVPAALLTGARFLLPSLLAGSLAPKSPN
ncbi:hypothetical protein [Inquilinus sp.]|uniref:hypothetical protein n=1 Tax=Inquilinus sp. TaxID=1932117 RepID=UPI0031E0EC36